MIKWLKSFFTKKKEKVARPDEAQVYIDACKAAGHVFNPKDDYEVTVLGQPVTVGHPDLCKECIEKSLNVFATRCDCCGEPILPGMPVAVSCQKPEYSKGFPYTCMGWDCCVCGIAYCGVWGMGRLVTLNELNPEKYAPGCSNLASAVINGPPGEVVVVNDFKSP